MGGENEISKQCAMMEQGRREKGGSAVSASKDCSQKLGIGRPPR